MASDDTRHNTDYIEEVIGIGVGYVNIFTDFQIQYNIIDRTGRRTYPRYFRIEFALNRAKHKAQPRSIDPSKIELQVKVVELRSKGWRFPTIARYLDISVGTAWNMANHSH